MSILSEVKDAISRNMGFKSSDSQRVAAEAAARDYNQGLDADPRRNYETLKAKLKGYDNFDKNYHEQYNYFATIGNTSFGQQKELLVELVAKLDKLSLDYQNIVGTVNGEVEKINSSDVVDEVKEATQFYHENSLNSLKKIIVELKALNDKLKTKL